ncbi:MAG: long-chain fatty acid--CoA ligase [Desulfuromonadales bacterium]|nr:long-chain fatty acid--CoA ligase [Desulfuromonadales bacterium]
MARTIPQIFFTLATERGERTALRRKREGTYRSISWFEMARQVRLYGQGVLNCGIEPGDGVAIMSPNCPQWAYVDLATMACGARTAPVYHTEDVATLRYILHDSASRILFLYSPELGVELIDHLATLPQLRQVVMLDGEVAHPLFVTLDEFLRSAENGSAELFAERLTAGRGDDIATLIYTSGTTGTPKGVLLSHANFLSNIDASIEAFAIGEEDECLSFLPLSHVFERMAGYYLMLIQGAVISYAESIDTVPANMAEVKPTIVVSVPRLYEKMYARILDQVLSGSWLRKQIFFGALHACKRYVQLELSGEQPGRLLSLGVKLARQVVFSKIHERLGGRLRFFVSGGAPLAAEIAEFFLAAGVPIYEGYGLSETSPVIAVNTPTAQRLGTVGRPISGTEVRIAADGEIMVRGPGVFRGYWNKAEETAEVLGDDGWLATGDIGVLDHDGYLMITDRKKDLIVTAGGKNIAPQFLENLFKGDKYLANAMVYGDGKPYLTALLVPNFDNLEAYAKYKKISYLNHCDMVNHARILDLIRRRIDRLQEALPSYQRIKRFTLISRDFSSAEGEVTPTLKVKRKVVFDHFRRELEDMYTLSAQGATDRGFCVIDNE